MNRALTTSARTAVGTLRRGADLLELHAIREGQATVPLPNGETMRLPAGGAETSRFWWHGWDAYEPATSRLWCALCGLGGTVIDVGANRGFFSMLALGSHRHLRVLAFEPHGAAFAMLEEAARLNDAGRIELLQLACSDRDGFAELRVESSAVADGIASIVAHARADRTERVATTTLDAVVVARALSVDVIKIDVERAEPLVLAGADATLRASAPTLIIEVLDGEVADAVDRVAADHGYRRFLMLPDGPVEERTVVAHRGGDNHVLCKRPEHLAIIESSIAR